jgi:holin-like protein
MRSQSLIFLYRTIKTMIYGMAFLLGYLILGEIIAHAFRLPIPGSAIAMLLTLLDFHRRDGVPVEVGQVADGLLANMAILFVPAGVGIMAHASQLQAHWLEVALIVVGGTLVTLLVTVPHFW